MRIDAHHHVWDLDVRDQDWIRGPRMQLLRRNFGLDELRPLTSAAGIDATVLVQTVTVSEETPELLALAEGSALVRAVVGWTDLTDPSVAEKLAALRDGTGGRWLRGIRHQVQGEPDPDWLRRKDVLAGLRAVGREELVYELLVVPHQLPAAIDAVSALPNQVFVLDHCAKPPIRSGELEPWAGLIRELAFRENVLCKLSGLITEADSDAWTVDELRPYVEVVLDAFGADRLMFGSDWPVCLLAARYPEVVAAAEQVTAALSESERAAIFGGTATSAYRLI